MSNKNDDLVIFEYAAFEKRLYDYALSYHVWAPVIQACIDTHNGEKNLNKLVVALGDEEHPYGALITVWHDISENVARHNERIEALIERFRARNLLAASEQPLVYLLDALNTLHLYTSESPSFGMTPIEAECMEKIRSSLRDQMDDWKKDSSFVELMKENPDLARLMGQDVHLDADTQMDPPEGLPDVYSKEIDLQNLQKTFREELDCIAKSDETDDIFRDVKTISNEIIPDIVEKLGSIVGNERFRSDLENRLEASERDIEDFLYRAQSNIGKQITATLDTLEEKFQETLASEIRPQLQQVSPYLALFVSAERDLKDISEGLTDCHTRTEAFIAEFLQLPKDIKDSCESFREDSNCLDALKRRQQNQDIDPEEVKVLEHLFGANGTDVFARLNCKPEDLCISENVEKVGEFAWEKIDTRYNWQDKVIDKTDKTSDERVRIFKHATVRLQHIYAYLEEKMNA